MKKSILAFTIAAISAGPALAQTNVTIYGVADAGISYADSGAPGDSGVLGVSSGQQSGSRLGFRGSEDLGGGLSAIFTLENGFSIDNGALGQGGRLFGRQAFVGLNSKSAGALKFGRQYNPIRGALESVDPFAFGLAGNISNVFDPHGERADNTVNYSTPNFGGFSGQVAYSLGEAVGSTSLGRQWGLSAAYANGPLRVVAAHHDRNLTTGTPVVADGDTRSTMLGGAYDLKMVKLHAAFAWNKGDAATGASSIDSRDMMAGVSVPLGAGTVLASYMRKDNKLADDADANVWALGYTYSLSKRTNLYASYAKVKNDRLARVGLGGSAAAGNDPSLFNVGIRHRF
ncbi:MAG: porin [Noviherbaspirillum sp.]